MNPQHPTDETKHPSYIETRKQNPMLVVRTSGGERFQFPYHHFLGGHYRPKSDSGNETYILEFALHLVHIEGMGLLPIATAIDEMRVRLLKPAAEGTEQTEARVTRIDVAYRHGDT